MVRQAAPYSLSMDRVRLAAPYRYVNIFLLGAGFYRKNGYRYRPDSLPATGCAASSTTTMSAGGAMRRVMPSGTSPRPAW